MQHIIENALACRAISENPRMLIASNAPTKTFLVYDPYTAITNDDGIHFAGKFACGNLGIAENNPVVGQSLLKIIECLPFPTSDYIT